MGDNGLPEVGDLLFSLVIGYIGALEFLYVVRHLYHWSFGHAAKNENDDERMKRLQESMQKELAEAEALEARTGAKAMKDGVLYKDGFRIDPDQAEIDRLKDEYRAQSDKGLRRQEIEAELKRQKKIEEETRKQLEKAEAQLARQQQEAKQIAKQEKEREEAENARQLLEAERAREEEQRKREEEIKEGERRRLEAEAESKRAEEIERETAENERKRLEAEKQREEEQRKRESEEAEREFAENERRRLEAEKQREEEQRKRETEEAREFAEKERKRLEIEKQHEEEQQKREREEEGEREFAEEERKRLEAEKQHEEEELGKREAVELRNEEERARQEAETQENLEKLIEEEREREALLQQTETDNAESEKLLQAEQERERKQKLIEENARKFLEADQEMVDLQQKMLEVVQQKRRVSLTESQPSTPVVEEPCIKKAFVPHTNSPDDEGECVVQKVKTQFGQTNREPYSLTSKPLLFTSVSDDGPSIEPQSSLSTQPSDDIATGIEGSIDIQYPQTERQEPEGEDNDNIPSIQYTDEYLRSLDGIKQRPLMREDGSGRRRAFKKRRSSGSSNSSRESRASREEEVKMFTSLEEEELQSTKDGESEFTPIKYTTEPMLKVKGHRRRHKRSPAKDAKSADTSLRNSLEMLNEENTNPWGEVVPEHYKETEFWKREKAMSIDEEEIDREKSPNSPDAKNVEGAVNKPKTSSFEEATDAQNKEAISALQEKHSKEKDKGDIEGDETRGEEQNNDNKTNLIFSGEYTKAMDKDWHSAHFCCWQCDESLTGQRYVIRDDHPYCIKCYENVFANTCEECNKIIGIDSKDLSYKDKHWHEACFLCSKCHLSLVDKQFGAKADKIYCGTCYDSQFASRCDGCGEVFRAGTKKMEYKTRQWHENCFCCCVCKSPIGTKSFIPREQEIYCAGCYEEKFATRCIKCNKVITSGGVTYKNEPWHRECFTCTHCNITLAGQRFTSRDEKPYCAECFGELFAKRCTSCTKPITGIGGTRFISFEDRHWHHDCFVCASCKTSLVGRGFITDGPDIICPECAKQRLM